MQCPICKKPVDPSPRNRYRPFCSKRCRTIDLGAWAAEGYRVAGRKVEDREHPDDRARRKTPPGQKPAPSNLPEKT